MSVEIREASYDDMIAVLGCSQFRDDKNAREIVRSWFRRSNQSWVGLKDGVIVCGWGIIQPTLLSTRAYIWLLNHEDMEEYKFCFVRQSKIWMEKLLKNHELVWGICLNKNDKAIKWLKWLGATFEPLDETKLQFEIRRR